MKIAPLCVLIIITSGTDGFHVENARIPYKEETGEKLFLRKLQTFKSDDPKEAKTVTWNQILADALVNRIKIFSYNKSTENERATDVGITSGNNLLENCVSQMMYLYKILIYDKINKRPDIVKPASEEDTEFIRESKKVQIPSTNKGVNVGTERDIVDPKDEVEIIEPRYHGKMCDGCEEKTEKKHTPENEILETTEIVQTSVTGCPAGLVASEDGSCTDSKSKFILSIPYQCPIGYRRDWLGYCRPQL